MRTVDYVDVLKGTADLAGLDRDNISNTDFRQIRQSHDRRLQTAWEFDFWPELLVVEKRYYRPVYSTATAYVATNEVYFPATGNYYQALTSTTGNDPANSSGVTQTAFWADASSGYDGVATYNNATAYVRGNQVYYPVTDRFYQLYAASSTGNLPTDASKWGVLTVFNRYVPYVQTGFTSIGDVIEVGRADPRVTTRDLPVNWWLSADGIQVQTNTSFIWPTFKLRTIRLRGELWANGTSYSIGDQAYYDTGVVGNMYDCIQATTSQPPTNTAFWTKTSIPLIFQRYLELGGYADWLRNDGQTDRADSTEFLAATELANRSEELVASQGQRKRTVVKSR